MARDTVVRVRLTDERNADLEEAAKSYGVAPATMATVIIGEWLDKRKREGDLTMRTPIIASQMTCHHVKKYASYALMSDPPQHPWSCELCGATGVDSYRTQWQSLEANT